MIMTEEEENTVRSSYQKVSSLFSSFILYEKTVTKSLKRTPGERQDEKEEEEGRKEKKIAMTKSLGFIQYRKLATLVKCSLFLAVHILCSTLSLQTLSLSLSHSRRWVKFPDDLHTEKVTKIEQVTNRAYNIQPQVGNIHGTKEQFSYRGYNQKGKGAHNNHLSCWNVV